MPDEQATTQQPEEPKEGGSYVRNEDGTLTKQEGTTPAAHRSARSTDELVPAESDEPQPQAPQVEAPDAAGE